MYIYIATIFFVIIFSGCSQFQELPEEKVVARAFNSYLYWSDLTDFLVDAKNSEDSFAIIQTYVQKWAKKKILLELAAKNLPPEQLDVSKEVEEYKNSLLIYRYQQAYIAQNLDTNVSESEIDEYYQKYSNELILNENIVKAFLIQVPRTFNQMTRLKNIFKSDKANDIKAMDVICNKYAYQCNDFKNEWVSFNKILSLVPVNINNTTEFLKTNKSIEYNDSNFVYLVHIKDYKLIGDVMPKEWGAKQIVIPNILVKRKLKLLEELENKSLEDFQKKNKIEFYYP
jgi:hypothetical protein